jgi:hypothetical protein
MSRSESSGFWGRIPPFFSAFSQSDSGAHFDQHKAFAPFFYQFHGNEFRSASGQPGPQYWQNRVDYKIAVSLDTTKKDVKGSVGISYKITALLLQQA